MPSRLSNRSAKLAKLTGLPRQVIARMLRSQNSRARLRLWLIDPCCWWCGCQTTLFLGANGQPVATSATVDHVWTRRAGRAPGQYSPKVLACHSCNGCRNKAEDSIKHGEPVRPAIRRKFTRHSPPELLDGEGSLYQLPSLEDSLGVATLDPSTR